MKFLLTTFLSALATMAMATDPHTLDGTLEHSFMTWMKEHKRIYENTNDMVHRMEIWMDNHGM